MTTEAKKSKMNLDEERQDKNDSIFPTSWFNRGMTKRELFSAMLMCHRNYDASQAVQMADELLDTLNKTT